MATIRLPNKWTPRPAQMRAWKALESGKVKRAALCWHRRAGKDDFALHFTATRAMLRPASYWHMLPLKTQARKAIWTAVNPHTGKRRIDEAFPKEIRARTNDQEMFIEFINGSTWQVLGSDDYDTHVGAPPAGVVFSEYALADPNAWAYIRPILAENDGWAMFISTPRGRNHFARLVQYAIKADDWYGEILTVDDSGLIPEDRIRAEWRELSTERGHKEAEAIIQQEYYCSFDSALPGSYYGEFMTAAERQGRVGDFAWLPNLPVGASWDLGNNDQTVIWFWQEMPSGRIRIIDVIAGSNVGIDWYAKRIAKLPYLILDHIWPHDGGHKNIRDVEGVTLKKTAEKLGIRPIRVTNSLPGDVKKRINAVRQILPLCEFNTKPIPHDDETQEEATARMERALDALRMYHREYDDKLKTFRDAPKHDWTSDYADSFGYMAAHKKPLAQTAGGAYVAAGASVF